MRYMNFSDIEEYTPGLRGAERLLEKSYIKNFSSTSRKDRDVFLSHSTKDIKLLPNIIEFIESNGASVYIDKTDEQMPSTTSPETGKILQDAIKSTKRFILFVTSNSQYSKWIPWELGIGDAMKGKSNIALLPAEEEASFSIPRWPEQEYLGLYQRIIWGKFNGSDKSEWIVYDHHKNSGVSLSRWLNGLNVK